MGTVLKLRRRNTVMVPSGLQEVEERFSEHLVEYFLKLYTNGGEKVLDPFAGLGTTMFVAERMHRDYYGFEPNPRRCDFIRNNVGKPRHVLNESALAIDKSSIPEVDFCISSPPYTHAKHRNNPLRNYDSSKRGTYAQFLRDMREIYAQVSRRLKCGGYCVIEISNLFDEQGDFCSLAWDVATVVSKVMKLEREIIVQWDTAQYGLSHTYCFAFRNSRSPNLPH